MNTTNQELFEDEFKRAEQALDALWPRWTRATPLQLHENLMHLNLSLRASIQIQTMFLVVLVQRLKKEQERK